MAAYNPNIEPNFHITVDTVSNWNMSPSFISGNATVAYTTPSTVEHIEINEFVTKQDMYELIGRLTETVYAQEMRIRELEEKLNNG